MVLWKASATREATSSALSLMDCPDERAAGAADVASKAGQDAAGGDRDLGRGMVNLTILLVILANIFHRY